MCLKSCITNCFLKQQKSNSFFFSVKEKTADKDNCYQSFCKVIALSEVGHLVVLNSKCY